MVCRVRPPSPSGVNRRNTYRSGLADRTAEMLMSDLDLLGFAGQYDYFYSPRDRKGSKGYVFINMTKPVYAQRFFDCVEMLNDPQMESLPLKWLDKTSIVQEARIQGRDQNLRHFWSICKGMWPVHDNVPYVHHSETYDHGCGGCVCSGKHLRARSRLYQRHFLQRNFRDRCRYSRKRAKICPPPSQSQHLLTNCQFCSIW